MSHDRTGPLDKKQSAELLRLLWALYDQRLGKTEAARLEQLMADHDQARRIYAQFFVTCGLLHWHSSERPATTRGLPGEPLPRPVRSMQRVWNRAYRSARTLATNYAALSMLVSGLLLTTIVLALALWTLPQWRPAAPPARPAIVAEISDTSAAEWDKASDGNFGVTALLSGDRLVLDSGLAEITFRDGTVVLLEGPAELTVDADSHGTLHQGLLTATVPQQAIGFRIDAPDVVITDLGTVFGARVVPGRFSEVYVYEGAVACAPNGQGKFPRQVISAGDAVRIEGRQLNPLAAASVPPRLAIALEPERPALAFDFAEDDGGMKFAGAAGFVVDPALGGARRLRLTDNQSERRGAAWYPEKLPVAEGFTIVAEFQFSFVRGVPADGMALVVHDHPQAEQLLAGEMGLDRRGLCIAIDVYQNEGQPEAPFLAVRAEHRELLTAPLRDIATGGTLSDGRPHTLRVDYRDGQLFVRIDGQWVIRKMAVDLANLPGGPAVDAEGKAWIGFAARTGKPGQNHDLLKWTFNSSSLPRSQ